MRAYAVLASGAVFLSAVLRLMESGAFEPYYGTIGPVIGTAAVVAVGGVGLAYLERGGWFSVRGGPAEGAPGRDVLLVLLVAALLALPVIGVDLLGGFSRNLNVVPPAGLLFYPVIALVAEIAFHVLPLALILAVGTHTASRMARQSGEKAHGHTPVRSTPTFVWGAIAAVAVIEPVFQVLSGAGTTPTWAAIYVGFHILVFNLIALALFLRRGFMMAVLFRVAYYGVWHILWGYARLRLLF